MFRFEEGYKVTESGCWIWVRAKRGPGYGQYGKEYAHRHSWERVNGPVPPGLYVCHRCDTPPCVNPDHLFLGTPKDNALDMVAKGRSAPMRGERNGNSWISDEKAQRLREARKAGATIRQLAEMFGIGKSQAHRICTGQQRTTEK